MALGQKSKWNTIYLREMFLELSYQREVCSKIKYYMYIYQAADKVGGDRPESRQLGENIPIKMTGMLIWNLRNKPEKYQNIVLSAWLKFIFSP